MMTHRLATLLLLAALLAGCAPAPAPALPPTAAPLTTITFAAFERDRETYAALIDAFNAANPDVQVQFVPLDEALTGVRRGRAPERALSFTNAIASAADTAALFGLFPEELASPAFQNLAPFVEADPSFDRADFFPAALPPTGEPVPALPLLIAPTLLVYDRDLWAREGLPAPDAAWQWSDLLVATDQLVANQQELQPVGLLNSGIDSHAATALLGVLAEEGVALADTSNLGEPAVLAAFEATLERIRSGALPAPIPAAGTGADTQSAAVAAGTAGLWPLELGEMIGGNGRDIGWALFPAQGAPAAMLPQLLVMSASTAHPDAAWRWLSFLSQQPVPPPGSTALGPATVPARRGQLETSAAWDALSPEQQAVLTAALERPMASVAAQVADQRLANALADALRAVLGEGTLPEEALARAQEALAQPVAAATSEVPPPVATLLPTPAADIVTVRYMPFYQDSQFIQPYIERFEAENPDIRVELREMNVNSVSFQSFAETADVFFWWDDALTQPEIVTAALDLQPLIDADLAFDLADYPAGLIEQYYADGRLYGLPQTVYLAHIGYNAELFDRAGIAPPGPGWTSDEFMELATQFASTADSPTQYGFTSIDIAEGLAWFVTSRGGALVLGEGDGLRPNFTDPAVRMALQDGLDLIRTASPKRFIAYSPATYSRIDNSQAALTGGSVAMWWDAGFSFSPTVEQPTFQRAMLPLPRDNAGDFAPEATSISLHISAATSHPEAAWRLLKFLSSEVPTRFSGFPARSSLAESAAFREAAPLGAAAVYAAYKPLLDQPLPPDTWSRLWQVNPYWLFRAADRALQGADLESELAEAQFLTEQYLACVQGGEAPGVCARQVDPSYDGELAP